MKHNEADNNENVAEESVSFAENGQQHDAGAQMEAETLADEQADSGEEDSFWGDADSPKTNYSLHSIFFGDILGGKWFTQNLGYMVLIIVMCILYISNGYLYQQEQIRNEKLNNTLQDRRFKALTLSSDVKVLMLRSKIEGSLPDTALKTSLRPNFDLEIADDSL